MKIDWKAKLSSRKLWVALAGFIASLLVVFNFPESDITKVSAMIMNLGTVAIYILSEASVDKARITSETKETKIIEQK